MVQAGETAGRACGTCGSEGSQRRSWLCPRATAGLWRSQEHVRLFVATATPLLDFNTHWLLRASADEGFFAGYDDGTVCLADLRMNAQPRWQHHLVRSS